MKTKRFRTLGLAAWGMILTTMYVHAQQAAPPPRMPAFPVTPNTNLVSPEVNADKTVTFRIWAPNANQVNLKTEGEESVPGATQERVAAAMKGVPMTKGGEGIWSRTVGPYPAGAYRYTFEVDGVSTTDPKNPAASESLSEVRSLVVIPGGFADPDVKDVRHGAVETVYYQSKTLGRMRRMHIYLPAGYEKGDATYPVFYLLHGGGDSDDSWTSIGRANYILDNLLAARRATPMIIVMPAGHVSRQMDFKSMGEDVAADPFANDLVNDVIPFVEHHYRVAADAQHRAIAGLSMGGVQTLNVALTHPGYFGYIGVFSSGWFPQVLGLFEQKQKQFLESSDKSVVKLFWFGAGKYDIALPNTGPAMDMVKKYGYAPEFHESEGFHAWNNWRDYLEIFAPRLFR